MAKNKTTETTGSVRDFILAVENPQRRQDSLGLMELMRKVSGCEPRMWGPGIIGFGKYHYRYASGHEGHAPLIGFSPRKAAISLYVFTGLEAHRHLLDGLGKFTTGKACVYIKKLADIDQELLTALMETTIAYLQERYSDNPSIS